MKGTRSLLRGEVIFICAALALSGCATTAPYVDSLHRFGAAGRAIQSHLKPASDDSVKALYESFDAALSEAEKAK